ncbi:hypothetical protein FC093_00315 [Ilyomonas limi]|uniref:Uncharacterized protein n=1 Tax=Ilyomonas limi TaxID=2575867 RepID=A0A4U3LAN7_9BACT|nr:outer membrane beta-barrel protein [Ilyomonas limi]TKK71504.1 hypothetical protein FC093_00315 [Ilyomonas limi]
MQDVENDMDELFRKAVVNYTLEAGADNWDTIVAQLSDDSSVMPVEINRKENGAANAIFLLLFLLIPLSTAMFSYYSNNAVGKSNSHAAAVSYSSPQQEINNNTITGKQNSITYSADKTERIIPTIGPFYNNETDKSVQAITPTAPVKNVEKKNSKQVDSIYSKNSFTASPAGSQIVNMNQQKSNDGRQQPITTNTHTPQKPHLYAGIIAGLALNEVKNQGFKKPGFDAGIIAGFRINKNAAVEVGLLYSKKYYFSNGKYFSMDKMSGSMPAEMKVLSVEGSSNLYQLPVAIKYDIVHKKSSTFFSSAGMSSYILTKEKNDYQTSMNGVQQNMKGMYKQVSAGFASSIDVSVGYEHTIQKGTTIRIQPYLQIPLKGMGMGSMQVMSAGIHIAYTR